MSHPLPRLGSPSLFSLLLHLSGSASFVWSFRFLATWDSPISNAYGWHFQYFTILGLAASLLCFALAALADVLRSAALFRLKNAVAAVAIPVEMVVSLLYWGLSALDPNLIVPEGIELPLLPDLSFHVAPAVFLTLDFFLFSPPWTASMYGALPIASGLAVSYWYWVELCFSQNGVYPYPLFHIISTSQRLFLFAFAALIFTASYGSLKWSYTCLNGRRVPRLEKNR